MRDSPVMAAKWVQVYQYLQSSIQEGRWQPGEKISAYRVAQELGVSRYPVQQAMRAIEADGLVTVVPQVGCVITHPSAEEMAEDTMIRAVLEELVGRLAAERILPEQLARIAELLDLSDECVAVGQGRGFQELNRQFHDIILEATRSRKLMSIVRPLSNPDRLREGIREFQSHHVATSVREHRAIARALEDHQPEAAGKLLRGHFERVTADLLQSSSELNSHLRSITRQPS